MPFKAGHSGNPKGRPPKTRALTALLESAGNETMQIPGGKKIARKRITAGLAWQLITEGAATLPNGKVLELAPKDWIDLYKWIYQHIDGAPKQEIDLNANGEIAFDYSRFIGAATRPISDNSDPGED